MSTTFPFVPKYGTEDQVNNQPITTGSMYMTPGKLFFDKSSIERVIIASKDSNYVYNQIIPSDTWSINHNLKKLPNVTVIDSAGSKCEGEIEYVDDNNLILHFSSEFSGKAILN